jgi:hypothetical protein
MNGSLNQCVPLIATSTLIYGELLNIVLRHSKPITGLGIFNYITKNNEEDSITLLEEDSINYSNLTGFRFNYILIPNYSILED